MTIFGKTITIEEAEKILGDAAAILETIDAGSYTVHKIEPAKREKSTTYVTLTLIMPVHGSPVVIF